MNKKEQGKFADFFSIPSKKGQMELSFGMIFSIIIVVIFISFATYVILTFLDFSDSVKVEQFQEEIQEQIDDIWKSPQGSNRVSFALPTKIEKICFFDESNLARGTNKDLYNLFLGLQVDENLMFYPEASGEGEDGIILEHINLANITSKDNPYCIDNENGKVTLNLKMNYGENLVVIS